MKNSHSSVPDKIVLILKTAGDLNEHFFLKETYRQVDDRCMKGCSTSLVRRRM